MKKTTKGDDSFCGEYWEMCGIRLFGRGEEEVLEKVNNQFLVSNDKLKRKPFWIATVNPEFVMAAEEDAHFKELLKKTTLNVVDGVGLIWAREVKMGNQGPETKLIKAFKMGVEILQGKHRGTLVTGADLMDKMCAWAEREKKTVYFLGGWNDRAEKTGKYFLKKYPKLKVVGYRAEDFDFKTQTDFLFVAYGMKRQEEWIEKNLDKFNVGIVMGVGRSFDYYSGDLKRAPKWIRKMGLEWLYSLYKEPKRWKRQMVLPKFIWKVLW